MGNLGKVIEILPSSIFWKNNVTYQKNIFLFRVQKSWRKYISNTNEKNEKK